MIGKKSKEIKKNFFLTRHWYILYFLFCCFTSKALPINENFNHITNKDGLSSNYTTSIVKDKSGFIWMGTSQGLDRYDGKNFKSFVHNPEMPNGLSDSHINYLFSDSYGELWIGTTKGGLCKYNENGTFDCYTFDESDSTSISNNQIWEIEEDNQGRLWAASQNGLNLFDRETKSFIRFLHNPKDSTSLPAEAVLDLLADRSGRLWIGTPNGIALMQPPANGNMREATFLKIPIKSIVNPEAKIVQTIEEDKEGRIWLASNRNKLFVCKPSLYKRAVYDPNNFIFHKIADIDLFHKGMILSLQVDNQNQLWIGTLSGLFSSDLNQFKNESWEDTQKEIQLSFSKINLTKKSPQINYIYEDNKDLVWFATKKGVYKYINYDKNIPLKKASSLNPDFSNFNRFCQDRLDPSFTWMSEASMGLVKYYIQKDSFVDIIPPPESTYELNNISTIYSDVSGKLWIGTYSGLIYRLSIKNNLVTALEVIEIPSIIKENSIPIWNIFEDKQGYFVFSTHRGLYLYEPNTKEIISYSEYDDHKKTIIGHNVFDAIQDKQGTYWLATAGGGLNKIKTIHGQPTFRNYMPNGTTNSIKSNLLFDLHPIDNRIWMATQSGIQEFDIEKEQFLKNEVLDQAISGSVLAITSDHLDNIWFTTDDGLFYYNQKTKILSSFNQADGVVDNPHLGAAYTTKSGSVLIGGENGFNLIHSEKLVSPSFSNELLITDIKTFNKSLSIGQDDPFLGKPILTAPISKTKKINLSYQHDFVTFEFSTLDYLHPNRYEYVYQLEGFDEKWQAADSRNSVTYTNLQSGEYTFKVKAKNHLGVWSKPVTLGITIQPPFWTTFPFILLASLGSVALLLLLQRRREYQIKKNNELLEQQVASRTAKLDNLIKELKSKEQSLSLKNTELEKYVESNNQLENFAYIASHDLQAPLRTIKSFVGLLQKSLKTKMSTREEEFFSYIVGSTTNMQELIAALLSFSRINSQKRQITIVNPQKLLDSIQADLNATLKEEKATIHLSDFPEAIHADRIKLKQLLQNLISNGIKFSKKDVYPIVQVNCEDKEDYWQFEVADNGIGIPAEFNQKIFQLFQRLHSNEEYKGTGIGLALCKTLVEQHNGEIWVQSEEGAGSRFFFTISKELN